MNGHDSHLPLRRIARFARLAAERPTVKRHALELMVFCPKCGDEYRVGFTRCSDCDTNLVDRLPKAKEPPPLEMVTVLETGDQSLVAVAKSVLEGSGIPCIARNERLQNLFGWGAIGTGFNAAMGPIRLQVLKEDVEAARELLAAQATPQSEDGDA